MNRITPQRYPYRESRNARGQSMPRPLLSITLRDTANSHTLTVDALLDTGATVNVVPYEIGLALGLSWEAQRQIVTLTGNLGQYEARGVMLIGQVGQFATVPLIFAWTHAENAPLLLGQVNFFAEFDVCFFWSQMFFQVNPKA